MVYYLVVSVIKLSSETLHIIVNNHADDHMMLCRSAIGHDLDEISHTCLYGLCAAVVTLRDI